MGKKHLILWFMLALASILPAQNIVLNATIDSTTIWIGDQTHLTLEVSQLPNQQIVFPIFSEKIIDGIDIVDFSTDTVSIDEGRIRVAQHYTITAFDDSLYYLPPFPFVENGDTSWSKSLSLNVVQPFEIDTTQNAITDIKGVYNPPIYWWGIIRIILLVLAGLALIAGGWWLYRKLKKHQDGKPIFEKTEPKRPAYEVAMESLNKIKAEKLWQQYSRQKEYHTELTDTIRVYINDTFNIGSTEMTSYEILDALMGELSHKKTAYEALKQVLTLADLVKFAKWAATPDENERSLQNAYAFVKETHIEETDVPSEEETTEKTMK